MRTLAEITQIRQDWVTASKVGGMLEGIADLLRDQYSTRTHFVYELLQNADDAKATRASFEVFHNRLEFTHNGSKLFDLDDIFSLTSIGKSLKQSDAIGRHGIGFKSVFSYTHQPRVDSGEYHFILKDGFVPIEVAAPSGQSALDPIETRITLPFDDFVDETIHRYRVDVDSSTARAEIDTALETLGRRTLLFLRHLRELNWTSSCGNIGHIFQVSENLQSNNEAREVILTDNKSEEQWLVFSRESDLSGVSEEEKSTQSLPIEIAFKIEGGKVRRAENTELVVYFPTEKDTRLGFLVQGPFLTTKARDNIKTEDEGNLLLIAGAAELAADSLMDLRDMGFVDAKSFEALPIRNDDFPSDGQFRVFFDTFLECLSTEALLPGLSGDFLSKADAFLPNGEPIRNLLSDDDLASISGMPERARWLSAEIGESATPDFWNYLTDSLNVEEFRPETLARRVDKEFLESKSDQWMKGFYEFLIGQKSLLSRSSPRGSLIDKPFIRVLGDKHLSPFRESGEAQVYLPPSDSAQFAVIKEDFVSTDELRALFTGLGLKEVGERELVHAILDERYLDRVSVDLELYEEDIACFLKFLTVSPSQSSLFSDYKIFLCDDGNWHKPSDCYLDAPFENTQLHAFFDKIGDSNKLTRMIPTPGESEELNSNVTTLARLTKVTRTLLPERSTCRHNPEKAFLMTKAPGRVTWSESDVDWVIPGLEIALSSVDIDLASLIWSMCSNIVDICWEARYRKNESQNLRVQPSQVCATLKESAWVPQLETDQVIFVVPRDANHEKLPGGFPLDKEWHWLESLEFGKPASAPSAEEILRKYDFTDEDVERVRMAQSIPTEVLKRVYQEHQSGTRRVEFPVRKNKNPERRKQSLEGELEFSPVRTYGTKLRSVKVSSPCLSPKNWLYQMYENDDDQVVCQMCEQVMPFLKRDSTFYFEAVEVFGQPTIERERHEQFLALCPVCSAKYAEYVKSDEGVTDRLRQTILDHELDPESGSESIPIQLTEGHNLAESLQLRFVSTHLHDLKLILQKDFDLENEE